MNQASFNWHLDLEFFSLLPYQLHSNFAIRFYGPGLPSLPKLAYYQVSGDAYLTAGYYPQKIACWPLKRTTNQNTELFWISKKTKQVLKMEQEFNGRYRYKIKLSFSEEEE